MPWITILIAIITYFTAKKAGATTGTALAAGALAGGATYAVTHYTDWLGADINKLDGVVPTASTDTSAGSVPNAGTNGAAIALPTVSAGTASGLTSALGSLLPLGVGAVAGATLASEIPWWVWAGGGFLLLKTVLK